MNSFPRARVGAAVAVAFICGLVFASGMNLTRFSWAQQKVTTSSGPAVPAAAVATLMETQNAFEAVVDRVKPAVVSIHVTQYAKPVSRPTPRNQRPQNVPPGFEDFMREFGGGMPDPDQSDRSGAGSGFIISKDGYILTNNHVVADMDTITVTLVDHRTFTAKVIGRDPQTDVALIKIPGDDFPTLSMGDDATARVGQWVLAVGNPLNLDFTVTAGIISAKGRSNVPLPGRGAYSITDFIQTDAAINPGNSGGPLVNIRGEVIGINAAIASSTGYYTGYGFAIPITLAKTVMEDLRSNNGVVRRAIVGVSLEEVTPEDAQAAGLKDIRGAKVAAFTDDKSPAMKAGVELNDIILAADGKPVDQVSTLQRIIRTYHVGQTVKLDVQRYGQRKQISVKLGEATPPAAVASSDEEQPTVGGSRRRNTPAPDAPPITAFDKLGLSVTPVAGAQLSMAGLPADARNGLLVTQVAPRSDARTKVNPSFDIIEAVLNPRRPIKTVGDLKDAVSGLKSGDVVALQVYTIGNAQNPGVTHVVNLRVP